MAETFLHSIAGRILGELASPAFQEIGLLWGVRDELDKLQNTVSTIKAVLFDAEEKQTTNHEVRDWLEKLELAVYEADDLLDDFSTEVQRRKLMTRNKRAKKVHIFFSRSNQLGFRYKMSQKVKAIRETLDAIAADRIKFHFTDRQEQIQVEHKRREESHSFVRMVEVVGRDEDKNSIVELLLEYNVQEDVSIIPIVGIGGLGKTTLAQLVYNDERVNKNFELQMWVCVSDDFDVKLIAQKIIESAAGKKCNRIQMDGVKDELKNQIDGRKYFLVLDDVWNENPSKWLKLRELLMSGARGSKILLTTRTQLVAKIMGTVSPYLLNGLSESESWSLFKKMTFEHGEEPVNTTLVAIGKEIVKKCVGLPLAIRSVGSLLHIKDTEKEWLYFKDNDLSKISQTESDIFPILKLSYDYLPANLKRCFSYCSLFPKDHRIDKKTLIQLWIAQGFIQLSDESQHLEDVGDQYFVDLVRRSFFHDVQKDFRGNMSCKLHDLIHDLAQMVVGSEICAIGLDAKEVDAKTRHVSVSTVMDSSWEIPVRLLKANKLRTFFLPIHYALISVSKYCTNESTCNKTISSFKRLRVLDLFVLQNGKVPDSIGKLSHLRYLDLSYTLYLELLPECICRLINLQTLKLNGCTYLKELPRGIKNLVRLRHLEIDGCSGLSHMPRGFGQLTSLRTLTTFVVSRKDRSTVEFGARGGLRELEGLVNLRGRLSIILFRGSIADTRKNLPNCYYLSRMEFLESLRFICKPQAFRGGDFLFESLRPHRNLSKLEIKNYRGTSFPRWMMVDIALSFPNLVEISLWQCHVCQHLPPFGLLPSLQLLKLWHLESLEYIYDEEEENSCSYSQAGLFPSLKMLELDGLKKLKGLGSKRRTRKEGVTAATSSTAADELFLTYSFRAMQNLMALESLKIIGCPQMEFSVDDGENGMQFQSLRRLVISGMPNLVSLPFGIQYLTTLQSLTIAYCQNLRTLPEWIGNLGSLQKLEIGYCKSLTSLPKGMRRLTALQKLIVIGCSNKLYVRCWKETGEDWPNIAHIQDITVSMDFLDSDIEAH